MPLTPRALAGPLAAVLAGASLLFAPGALAAPQQFAESALADPAAVTSASWDSAGDVAGRVSPEPLLGFPTHGTDYLTLSTGRAVDVVNASQGANSSQPNGGSARGTAQDVAALRIKLDVPSGASCMKMDFRFFSEEYPEYVGQVYNDGFLAELDPTTTWSMLSDHTIEAPDNFALTKGGFVSINSVAGYMNAANAAGTVFDGGTELLKASSPVTPGAHDLVLTVFDDSDGSQDSAVFVDNIEFLDPPACPKGLYDPSDVTDPETTIDSGPSGTIATTAASFAFSSNESPVAFQCRLDEGDWETCTSAKAYTGLALGEHQFQVRAIDAVGNVDETPASRTFVVDTPPAATAETSTGVGTAPQAKQLPKPAGGTIRLLDGTTPVDVLVVPGEGTYKLDPATGIVTFTPQLGFAGVATPIAYRATSATGKSADSTFTATVTKPAAPAGGGPKTTTGTGTEPQVLELPKPPGGTTTLVGPDGKPTNKVPVPGQGTYELDPATGKVTFTPELGFKGTPTPVSYKITDAYEQTSTGTYGPTVSAPAAPQVEPTTGTTGEQGESQARIVEPPKGGTLTLLDADGRSVLKVVVAGEGTYELDPVKGTITFTPEPGFTGAAAGVKYRVTDAYGQAQDATYKPTVQARAAAAPAVAETPAPAAQPAARCVSRRAFTINWVVAARVRLATVKIMINGKRYAALKGDVRSAVVDLKGRGAGTAKVVVTATAKGGRKLTTQRTYQLCASAKRTSAPATLMLRTVKKK